MIEHIFGFIKQKFWILLLAPVYGLDIQEILPPALCAIHSFTREHDSEIMALDDNGGHIDYDIAEEMWIDHLSDLQDEASDEDEDFEDEEGA